RSAPAEPEAASPTEPFRTADPATLRGAPPVEPRARSQPKFRTAGREGRSSHCVGCVVVVSTRDLAPIFKAYDIRGTVPHQLDEAVARRGGSASAEWPGAPRTALGRDCRLSSPDLAAAFVGGATSRGVDVVELGLTSTDLVYFASGSLNVPAAAI